VPSLNDPNDMEFEAASSRLKDGLKSCQTVVSNYRALFADEEHEGIVAPDMIEPEPVDRQPAN
jgi:hypothetical protein